MPDAIQSLWIGARLSAMERLCISSFLSLGHPFHLYVYDHVEGIPLGTTVMDANTVLPASRIFTYRRHNTYAGFANFFRYKLLLEKGGWFVDADLICLKPFDFDAPYVFSSEGLEGRQTINVGAIKVPPGSQVMEYAWSECEKLDTNQLEWSQCGPQLAERAIDACGLNDYVQRPEVFCPVYFTDWQRILEPDAGLAFDGRTYAVHLWNELWRRAGQDKDCAYPSDCLYEQLKQRYL